MQDRSIRSSLLTMIVAEARRYGVTATEIAELSLRGEIRPELMKEMQEQAEALGVPDEMVTAEIRVLFDADRLTVDDLLILVQGYAAQADNPILPVGQARELAEMALRLSKQTRRLRRRMEQARVMVEAEHPAPLEPTTSRRPIHGPTGARMARIAGRGL